MDIQLNLTSSSDTIKKAPKKRPAKNKAKPNAITESNFNFVQRPKLEGKIIARQRKAHQIEAKNSTFSFTKNKETDKNDAPSNKQKSNQVFNKNKNSNVQDDEVKINVETTPDVLKSNKHQNFTGGTKFKQKTNQNKKADNSSKRNFQNNRNQQDKPEASDANKKPTYKQIAALFKNNPEIPKIGQRHVKPVDEKLFSGKNFADLNIHPFNVALLEKNMGLKELTVVQQKAIPIILQGRDVLVRSQTGSGKTLAYALPIIEALQAIRPKIKRNDGIKALIIVPTRELALQTYELFVKLVRSFAWIVPGYLIGGENRQSEKARIRKGFNILIATPGRISDHLKNTVSLKLNATRCLILDEADRLLDMGYEKDVSSIVDALESHKAASKYDPMALMKQTIKKNHIHFDNEEEEEEKEKEVPPVEKPVEDLNSTKYQHELTNVFNSDKRQTVLLSATLTKAVETLAGLTMENPVFIDSSEDRGTLIADSIVDKNLVQNVEEDDNDNDDLEIVPQEESDADQNSDENMSDDEDDEEEEDDDNEEEEDSDNEEEEEGSDDEEQEESDNEEDSSDDSSSEDEDSIKKNAPIYKGIKAFSGTVEEPEKKATKKIKNKPKNESKNVPTKSAEDSGSDSDYDFFEATKNNKVETPIKDTTILTDSGTHSNPFQNAIQNAIAQDEMVVPSSVTQIYMVIPMKLRLITLSALIVERCVNTTNGKMIVFMATQDLIDYHCEILSRILTGKPPKKFAVKGEKSKKKKNINDEEVAEEVESKIDTTDEKLAKLINKEPSDDEFEYNYDGIPLDVYEAKMRAEKAFVDVEFSQLHGSMDQKTRTEVFKTFRNAKSGVLLCTDVAARGLDLPHVDCIVQYTGPISATDYVHRVGRTARAGNVGTAIMFLLPSEVLFVRQLEERRIRLHQEEMEDTLGVLGRVGSKENFNKYKIGKQAADQEAATALQQNYEELVEADKELYVKACKAFTSWMRFYSTYPREARAAFDRKALHAGHAARALALRKTPKEIARSAPKDKQEKPYNRLSNQKPEEKKEKTPKKKPDRNPAGLGVRPTSARAAKRDRMNLLSEFDSGLEPAKKKKK